MKFSVLPLEKEIGPPTNPFGLSLSKPSWRTASWPFDKLRANGKGKRFLRERRARPRAWDALKKEIGLPTNPFGLSLSKPSWRTASLPFDKLRVADGEREFGLSLPKPPIILSLSKDKLRASGFEGRLSSRTPGPRAGFECSVPLCESACAVTRTSKKRARSP